MRYTKALILKPVKVSRYTSFAQRGRALDRATPKIYRQITKYEALLKSYSQPLLDFIQWEPTSTGNVRVLNDTGDYYRFFDATPHAEFLYQCVEETIECDLPQEVAYLEAYDQFARGLQEIVDMPERKVALLQGFLRQGGGHLSKSPRTIEFATLTDVEIGLVENLYNDSFAGGCTREERR